MEDFTTQELEAIFDVIQTMTIEEVVKFINSLPPTNTNI